MGRQEHGYLMQPLEWWVSSIMKKGVPISEEDAYTTKFSKDKLFIVENQDEADLAQALQYIYGTEVDVIVGNRITMEDILSYLNSFSRVYTSWDPLDSQR